MPIDTRRLTAENYQNALSVGADAAEYDKVWALNVLSGGNAKGILDNLTTNGGERDVSGALANLQAGIRDNDPTALFTEDYREALKHADYDDFIVGKAREFAEKGNSPIGFFGRVYKKVTDGWSLEGVRGDVLDEMNDEHRELFGRIREAQKNVRLYESNKNASANIAAGRSGQRSKVQELNSTEGLPEDFDYEQAKKFLDENKEWASQVHEKAWWRSRDKDAVDAYMAALHAKNIPVLLSAIKKDLSPEAGSILDSCAAHGYDWDDSRWPDFQKLSGKEKEIVVSTVNAMKRPSDANYAFQVARRVWDMASGVLVDSPWDTVVATSAWFTDRDYQEASEERAFRRKLLQKKFADWGFLGNTVAEAFEVAGYGAAMWAGGAATKGITKGVKAIGAAKTGALLKSGADAEKVFETGAKWFNRAEAVSRNGARVIGTGLYAIDNQRTYLERIQEQGGDVNNFLTQLTSWVVGVGSGMVESIQWDRMWTMAGRGVAQINAYSKITHSLLGKMAAKYGIHDIAGVSLGRAAAIVGKDIAAQTFFECAEEAIQQTMEEVAVQIGADREIRLGEAMAQGADAFVQSLGPMALTMVVGTPVRAYRGALSPSYSDEDRKFLLSTADKVRDWMNGGAWQPAANGEQSKSMDALQVAFQRWANSESAEDALNTLQRMGFSRKDAIRLGAVFQSVRANTDAADLPAGTGVQSAADIAKESGRQGRGVEPVRNKDGSESIETEMTMPDGRKVKLRETFKRDAGKPLDIVNASDAGAVTIMESLLDNNDKGVEARANEIVAGRTLEEVAKDADARAALQELIDERGLKSAGNSRVSDVKRDADGNLVSVNVDISLLPWAWRGTVRHEHVHAIQEVAKVWGLSDEQAKALAESAANHALAPKASNERWREEVPAKAAERAQLPYQGPVGELFAWAVDSIRSVLGIEKKRRDARNAVEWFLDAMRTGRFGSLAALENYSAADALLDELAQAGEKAATESEKETPPAEPKESGAEEETADPSEGEENEPAETSVKERENDPSYIKSQFKTRAPLTLEQMALLAEATPGLDTEKVWGAGYRWNDAEKRWQYVAGLARPVDARDLPQTAYMGVDGQMHEPAAERHQIVGESGLGTADNARELEAAGADAFAIWKQTGWWKGRDGKWRLELPDIPQDEFDGFVGVFRDGLKKSPRVDQNGHKYVGLKISQLADRSPWIRRIVDMYPSLGDVPFFVRPTKMTPDGHLGQTAFKRDGADGSVVPFFIEIGIGFRSKESVRSTFVHEIQHAIQALEGFDNGGSDKGAVSPTARDDWKGYASLPGEIESRLVQTRMEMSAEERSETPPWETERLMLERENENAQIAKALKDSGLNKSEERLAMSSLKSLIEEYREKRLAAQESGRHSVSPDFAMDGTVVDALPAHLREDGRRIVAERANTPSWMTDPDGTPTDLSERDWLRREAETRHSISGIYTGSAADYDAPSLHYIGTGEGAQVYGWGLYGSNARGVAESYAMEPQTNPEILDSENRSAFDPTGDAVADEARKALASMYIAGAESVDKAVGMALARLREKGEAKSADWLQEHRSEFRIGRRRNAVIYEQTFFTNRAPGDESRLLLWYSDQRPRNFLKKIRDNLSPEQADAFKKAYDKAYRSGPGGRAQAVFNGDVYQILSDVLGSQRAASEFLRDKCDIDGVKYPVDSFRGPIRDGNVAGWNYVSFRDDNIRVDHKWVDGEQRYSISSAEFSRWNAILDDFEAGKVGARKNLLVLNHTPIVLRRLGASNLPVTIRGGVLMKIVGDIETSAGEHHGIPVSELRKLQIELDNPIAVFDSSTQPGSLVVLTRIVDSQNNERAVVVLRLDRESSGGLVVNDIVSAYGKDKQSIENWTAWNLLRYVNKQARRESARWLQLPGDSSLRARGVLTENDFTAEQLGVILPQSASDVKRHQISGPIGAEALGIRGLADAEAMERSGADRLAIWRETGWWRGKDGEWRVEIPDFELNADAPRLLLANSTARLADLIPADSAILKAYPSLGKMRIDAIESQSLAGRNNGISIDIERGELSSQDKLRTTLAHELQHSLQTIEGFARGGSWDEQVAGRDANALRRLTRERNTLKRILAAIEDQQPPSLYEFQMQRLGVDWNYSVVKKALDEKNREIREMRKSGVRSTIGKTGYNNLAGEAEARLVQKRLGMTPEERAARPPWEDFDVAESEQIVRGISAAAKPTDGGSKSETDWTPRFSVTSLAEAAGFGVERHKDGGATFVMDGVRLERRDGKLYANKREVPPDEMRARVVDSPLGKLVLEAERAGYITPEEMSRQYDFLGAYIYLMASNRDAAATQQFVGSLLFTAMKSNSDKQYTTTYDFPSICTKTQAVIDAISAKAVAKGAGLKDTEIKELYQRVAMEGLPVPCAECYVFSRWIGVGGLLDNISKYQRRFDGMSPAEVRKVYDAAYAEIEKVAAQLGLNFGKAKGKLAAKFTNEWTKLDEKVSKARNQGEEVDPKDERRLEAMAAKMDTVKAMTWIREVYFSDEALTKVRENHSVPGEILFDLNRTEEFARDYAAAWAFRCTQGAGYGKAITPYAEAVLGEGILVESTKDAGYIKQKQSESRRRGGRERIPNVFLELDEDGNLTPAAQRVLVKARMNEYVQAFLGGQRIQATSAARPENFTDYLIAFVELQAMGAFGQGYTKVLGAVDLFAEAGFGVNMSMMPLGGGLDKNGVPVDSPVGGIPLDEMKEKRKRQPRAGSITIGVNDEHIRALFRQEFRDFVIPYHASGGNAQTVAFFRETMEKFSRYYKTRGLTPPPAHVLASRSTDYTSTQNDKVLSDFQLERLGLTKEQIDLIHRRRAARIAILTDKGATVDKKLVKGSKFLSKLYRMIVESPRKGQSEDDDRGRWEGLRCTKATIEDHIFPMEFWDESVDYDHSGVNSRLYLEYCKELGFLHRFSGMRVTPQGLAAVSGYNHKGERVDLTDLAYVYKDGKRTDEVEDYFWKTLVDRRMYDNEGKYIRQGRITISSFTMDRALDFARYVSGVVYDKEKAADLARRIGEEERAAQRAGDDSGERHSIGPAYSLFDDRGPRTSGDEYLVGIAATAILAGKEDGLEDKLAQVAAGLKSEISAADAIRKARRILKDKASERAASMLRQGKPAEATRLLASISERSNAEKHIANAMQEGAVEALRGERDKARALAAILREETGIGSGELTNGTGVDWGRVLHGRLLEKEAERQAQLAAEKEERRKAREDGEESEPTADELLGGEEVLDEESEDYVAPDQIDTLPEDDPRRIAAQKKLNERREKSRRILEKIKARIAERRAQEEEERRRREAESGEEEGTEEETGGGEGEHGEGEPAPESEREFTVEEALAILKEEDMDFSDGETVAAFLREIVGHGIRMAENGGEEPAPMSETEERRFWRNPTVVKQYALSMRNILQDWARGMLDHGSFSYAQAMRLSQEMGHWGSATAIERTASVLVDRISAASIKQTTRQIVDDTRAYLKRAVGAARFSDMDPVFTQRVMGAVKKDAQYIRRVLAMSAGEVERELEGWTDKDGKHHPGLDEILEDRERVYRDAGAKEDEYLGDSDYMWAARRKAILEDYGGMRDKLPGEARELASAIREWIDLSLSEFALEMARRHTSYENDKAVIVSAVRRTNRDGSDRVYEKVKGLLSRATDVPLATIEQELREMFAYATGEDADRARELTDRWCHRLADATQRYETLKQEGDTALEAACRGVFKTPRGYARWIRHLADPIPEGYARQLSKTGRRTMTYGQALHLYGYLCQTDNETYRENIARYGREGQRDLLEREVLSAEDLKMVGELREIYAGRRADLSEAKRRITGIGFGSPSPFYLPVKVETGARSGMDSSGGQSGFAILPEVFADRVKHQNDVDETADILAIYLQRLDKSARVIAFGDLSVDALHVFGAKEVKDAMERFAGKDAQQYLMDHLVDILSGEPSKTREANDVISRLSGGVMTFSTYTALWGNLNTALKQSVSQYASALRRRDGDPSVTSDLFRVLANPARAMVAYKELTASRGWRARYGAGGIMEEVSRLANGKGKGSLLQKLLAAGMTPIQIGDAFGGIPVALGAYIRLRDEYATNHPDATYEEACEWAAVEAMHQNESTQQSSQTAYKPSYSRRGGAGKRLLYMFSSASNLQASWEALALREWRASADPYGDRNLVESILATAGDEEAQKRMGRYLRAWVVNHLTVPLLMELVSRLFSAVLGYEPPEPEEEAKNIAILVLLGQYGRMAWIGSLADAGLRRAFGEKGRRTTAPSVFNTLDRIINYSFGSVWNLLVEDDPDAAIEDLDKALKASAAPYRHVRAAVDNWSE